MFTNKTNDSVAE